MPDTFWQRVSALVADLREAHDKFIKVVVQDSDTFEHDEGCPGGEEPRDDCAACRAIGPHEDEEYVLNDLERVLGETEETHKHLRPEPQVSFLSAIAGTVQLGPEQQFPGNLVVHDDSTIAIYQEGNRPLVKFRPIQRVVLATVEGGEPVRRPVKIETVTETGSPRVFYTGEEYVSVSLKRDIVRDLMQVLSLHCRTADGISDVRRAMARVLDAHLGGGETPVFD